MRCRTALLLGTLGACGFQTKGAPDDAPASDGAFDAATGSSSDPTAAAFCDRADPHLMVCYELEGDTKDGSSNQLDAKPSNVSFVPGKVGMAMQFAATSAADVSDSPVFDVGELTIEAWIWPEMLPSNRAGIVDNNGQYGFFVYAGGDLRCSVATSLSLAQVATRIPEKAWTHVACTRSGASAAMYVNGVRVATAEGLGALGTGGTTGISLAADNPPGAGSRLIGLIDQVRMFDVGRTTEQICADAGGTSCP